jgi:hypothetical protein
MFARVCSKPSTVARRRVAAAGLLGSTLALLGAGAVTAATSGQRLTQPVQATKGDVDPARTYTSPSIAVDPENPQNVVMAFVEARTRRCGLMRSTDGGDSWKVLDASPATAAFPVCFVISGRIDMAPVAFGRNHTLYYGLNGYDDTDGGVNNGNISVLVARSDDMGDSWKTTVVHNTRPLQPPNTDSARPVSDLAVDTSGKEDVVYVAWRSEYRTSVAPNLRPREPQVAVSTDGGKTFSDAVNVSAPAWAQPENRAAALMTTTTLPGTPPPPAAPAGSKAAQPDQAGNFGGSNPSLTVDDKGNVYVAWITHSSNITPAPVPAVWLSKSTDHGKTYTASAITPFQQGLSTFGSQRIRWSPKGGPNGTLHVVYEGTSDPNIANNTDTYYQRSTDGGKTWTQGKAINDDDPKQLAVQIAPNLSVAPDGRVDVAWWDSRNDPGIRGNDVYYTSSSDNGSTWSKNTRITDQIVDRRIGIWANGYDVNVPPGIASTDKFLVVGWDDTRNGNQLTQTQDLFTVDVQLQRVGGGTSGAAKVALAAVGGVAVVGLVLLLVSLTNRRPAPSSPTGAREEPSLVR